MDGVKPDSVRIIFAPHKQGYRQGAQVSQTLRAAKATLPWDAICHGDKSDGLRATSHGYVQVL